MKLLIPVLILLTLTFSACQQKADLIVKAKTIYTVNDNFDTAEAMAIKDGRIVAVGTYKEVAKAYTAGETVDAGDNIILPGFMDAHAHFFGLGRVGQIADLRKAKSWDKTIEILNTFAKEHPDGWLTGRGWDQNEWDIKEFPTKEKLDALYPDRPVYLTRIDGHAAIVNQKALDIAGYTIDTKIAGGNLLVKNGQLTGVLIDMAKDKMATFIPKPNDNQVRQILTEAQEECLALGLTSVVDAGLESELVEAIEHMYDDGTLKIRLNIMLSESKEQIDYLIKRGEIKTDRLHVNGFKFYSDGALGSRGAYLLKDYTDDTGNRGLLLLDTLDFKEKIKTIFAHGFQVNTHAIGDAANRLVLRMYSELLPEGNDRRWRIEHAQVIAPEDFELFGRYNIIPSVQPTHATSDMSWAAKRLGEERVKSAYAYKQLFIQNGWMPLGTDFPIEEVNPLFTFYAAVARKSSKGYPKGSFQTENALTREEALKGMTIWAAKGSFEEIEKGSLETGKFADFIVLDQDLLTVPEEFILKTKVLMTYVDGEKVYEP